MIQRNGMLERKTYNDLPNPMMFVGEIVKVLNDYRRFISYYPRGKYISNGKKWIKFGIKE